MTITEKLHALSRTIETQMREYHRQIEDLMDEAEEEDEEIDIVGRGMYVNMVSVMEEVAPEAPCFYDVVNQTATATESQRSYLDFFFDQVNDELSDELS